jgi:hypothetical protein
MLGEVTFDVQTPLDDGTLVAHVLQALSLGLPELRDFEYPWTEDLTVVASGPSSRRAPLAGRTLALNGSLKLFTDKGLAPTYWAGCDPQEALADFLMDAPESTVYLVASKCHPAVFERLAGRKIILWHVGDEATKDVLQDRFPVACAVSITLVCFELMARIGWRHFHVWGWDGCLMDGQGYANAQVFDSPQITIEIGEDGKRVFASTHTWALEAQDAIAALHRFPFLIHIHGGGYTGELLKAYLPSRIVTDPR